MTAAPATSPAPKTDIGGMIDATEEDRLYGWAWDRNNPDDRLTVEIWMDDQHLLTTSANQERSDLKNNAIGDGFHAFTGTIAELADPSKRGRIRVVAKSPRHPEAHTLLWVRNGSKDETDRQDLGKIIEAAERQKQATLRMIEIQKSSFSALSQRIDTLSSETATALAAAELPELRQQISNMEIFLVRIDENLHNLATLAGTQQNTADHKLRRITAVLAVAFTMCLALLGVIYLGHLP